MEAICPGFRVRVWGLGLEGHFCDVASNAAYCTDGGSALGSLGHTCSFATAVTGEFARRGAFCGSWVSSAGKGQTLLGPYSNILRVPPKLVALVRSMMTGGVGATSCVHNRVVGKDLRGLLLFSGLPAARCVRFLECPVESLPPPPPPPAHLFDNNGSLLGV